MLDIIKAHAVNNLCYIAAKKMTPKGIVVHSTGANNPYLKRYVDAPKEVGTNKYGNHWNVAKPEGRTVCVHAFIGYDKDEQIRVAEILPLDICCWGVGKGKKGSFNSDPAYIQFEICEDKLNDRNYYRKVFATAAEYCAELCHTYNIDVEKIVGHCEAYRQGYGSNHGDPEHWMKKYGETMNDFRGRVSEILKSGARRTEIAEDAGPADDLIEKGDLVAIASNATYYKGKEIPLWVRSQNWYVKSEPVGDRVVVDKNEAGTNYICSPIHKKHLKIVKKANSNQEYSEGNNKKCPFLVKVTIGCLYIHKDAGLWTEKVGRITGVGVYTIVEEKECDGIRWGRLKSGAGWIRLDAVVDLNSGA